jgi:hypothetical protein
MISRKSERPMNHSELLEELMWPCPTIQAIEKELQ